MAEQDPWGNVTFEADLQSLSVTAETAEEITSRSRMAMFCSEIGKLNFALVVKGFGINVSALGHGRKIPLSAKEELNAIPAPD
jgi:hypothetical protein